MFLNKIFSYWEGEKPDYIKLCQKSLILNCYKDFEINILDENQSLIDLTPVKDLPINLKVDWLKANLIHNYGGFWIDADMIVMQSLKPLIKDIEKGFCGIPGFFGAPPVDKMLEEWIEEMDKVLGCELTFSSLIQPLLKNTGFKEFEPWTKEMICPIYHTGDEFNRFFDKFETLEKYVTNNCFVVTLYNSSFNNDFKRLSQRQIMDESWLISKMFNKAIDL